MDSRIFFLNFANNVSPVFEFAFILQGKWNFSSYLTVWLDTSILQTRSRSISQSISQSINQSINQSISQSVNQSISQSVNQSISQSVSHSYNPSKSGTPNKLSPNIKTLKDIETTDTLINKKE